MRFNDDQARSTATDNVRCHRNIAHDEAGGALRRNRIPARPVGRSAQIGAKLQTELSQAQPGASCVREAHRHRMGELVAADSSQCLQRSARLYLGRYIGQGDNCHNIENLNSERNELVARHCQKTVYLCSFSAECNWNVCTIYCK